MHTHILIQHISLLMFKSPCSRQYLNYFSGYNTSYQNEVSSLKRYFCRQSMCQLVTFTSHIVQFAAVCDFNQASALVKMRSACWLHMRSANGERGEKERERGREVLRGMGQRLETKSCAFNSETWISICPLTFLTAISKGKW